MTRARQEMLQEIDTIRSVHCAPCELIHESMIDQHRLMCLKGCPMAERSKQIGDEMILESTMRRQKKNPNRRVSVRKSYGRTIDEESLKVEYDKMHAKGMKDLAIVVTLGITQETLTKYKRKWGYTKKPGSAPEHIIGEEGKRQYMRLAKEGLLDKEIADEMDIAAHVLSRLKNNVWKLRGWNPYE